MRASPVHELVLSAETDARPSAPSQISYFNWISWINPNSVAVNAVFGSISGLGLNPIPPLDWSQFYGSTVLVLPFFSTLNQFIGMLAAAPFIIGCVAALLRSALVPSPPRPDTACAPRLQLLVCQRLRHGLLPAHLEPHR